MRSFSLSSRRGSQTEQRRALARRGRWAVRLVAGLCIGIVSYHLMWTYWLAGVFVPEYEIDKTTGRKKIRRRPELLTKQDIVTKKQVPTSPFDGVMEGVLTLINIILPPDGLVEKDDAQVWNEDGIGQGASYAGVQGVFCHISWERQQRDPSSVPMFRDLQQQSPLCRGTTITINDMDLHQLTLQARLYDQNKHNFTATAARAGHQIVPPTAVVFHETRCGSTLVSNMLASSMPNQVRSYSESNPPLLALMACDVLKEGGKYCDPLAQRQLIQDVFYLMGRVTRPEKPQYVYYKIQSIGARYISQFRNAMPRTPWAFVFRDSVEVLMSHFKNYQKGQPISAVGPRPVCLRSYGKPPEQQHALLHQMAQSHNRTISSWSKEEFCAAHLATLARSALDEYRAIAEESSSGGSSAKNKNSAAVYKKRHRNEWFWNYNQLPHVIWEDWLPRLHVGYVSPDMVERMQKVSNVYSKNKSPPAADKKQQPVVQILQGNNNNNREWHEDSSMKQQRAPDSIKKAARLFLDPLYQEMQAIQMEQNE